jgi:hypothetical protein
MYSPSTVATEGGGVAVGGTGVAVGNWGVGVLGVAKEAQADMLQARSRTIKVLFKKWGLKNIVKIIPT